MTEIDVLKEFVTVSEGEPKTDSRKVAKKFNKKHYHIMRDIRNLIKDCPEDWAKSNFGFRFEINELQNGKPLKYCEMSKDAFMLLVMGFDGKEAVNIKIKFIEAFNKMAEFIKNHTMSLWQKWQTLQFKDASSFEKASYGSKLMLQRKREKPVIQQEIQSIASMLQSQLFLN